MTDDLLAAAAHLADVIAAESAALAAFDLRAAAATVTSKQPAARGICCRLPLADSADRPGAAGRSTRSGGLTALAQENRRLLERAIAAQARLMEIIARASCRELATRTTRYGVFGAPIFAVRPRPIACLRARLIGSVAGRAAARRFYALGAELPVLIHLSRSCERRVKGSGASVRMNAP